MHPHRNIFVLWLLALLLATSAQAQTLFTDDFEATLSQWTGKNNGTSGGVIVADPLRPNNRVLSFTRLESGGDIFSSLFALTSGQRYRVAFEYLGLAKTGSVAGNFGAYAGLANGLPGNHLWYYGTGTGSGAKDVLVDDGKWRTYQYDFTAPLTGVGSSLRLMFEDFTGVTGDVYFDNVRLIALPSPTFLAVSTFDTSAEGWTFYNDATFSYISNFGNPAGSLRNVDRGSGQIHGFQASTAFLGNKAAAYLGALQWDIYVNANNNTSPAEPDVELQGGGLTLALDIIAPAAGQWRTYRAAFDASTGWRVGNLSGPVATDDQLQAVLADLQRLRIRAEFNNGGDTDYLDNVRLESGILSSLAGQLTLLEINPQANPQPIAFIFHPFDGSGNFTRTVLVPATGEFALAGLPKQSYTLHIKGAKYLTKRIAVDTTQGDLTGVEATLIPGDANNDNHVNIFDLAILAEDFNTVPGDANWNDGRADFNADLSVDIFDLAILAQYFNRDGDSNPPPTLVSLDPTTASQGSNDLILLVTGMDFLPGAVLLWGGQERPTTVVSSTLASASIPASDLLLGGTVEITLTNSPPNGDLSNPLVLTVVNPIPTLASLNPESVTANSQAQTLILMGSQFTPQSVVTWQGQNRETTYLSPTQLRATIPATDLTTPGTFPVAVTTPAPGGGTSSNLSVTVVGIAQMALGSVATTRAADGVHVTLTLKNSGTATATELQLKTAKLGGSATITPLPLPLPDLAPGETTSPVQLVFPASVLAGDRVLVLTLTSTGRSYSVSALVKVP